jgi:fatty acid desaturase
MNIESTESIEPSTHESRPSISSRPKEMNQDELITIGQYNQEIQAVLPKETFKRNPLRGGWIVVNFAVMYLIGSVVLLETTPVWAKLLLGIAFGIVSARNTFLAHEILHGAIFKNKTLEKITGFLGFTNCLISPTYWCFWHNKLHHGNTQLLYKDPDAFPTRSVWKKSKFMQKVFKLSPGSGYLRSIFYFFYWFSFQAFINQAWMRFGNKMWDRLNHKKVTIEFIAQIVILGVYLYLIGPSHWIYLAVIPFAVQNYTLTSYIFTNHNLCPYTKVNDALINSLTVTNHPVWEFLHMNFGYHTEHHIFPNMPMSSAKKVNKALKTLYPDKFQELPKARALKLLYTTPRVYKNRTTLVHPETGREVPLPIR